MTTETGKYKYFISFTAIDKSRIVNGNATLRREEPFTGNTSIRKAQADIQDETGTEQVMINQFTLYEDPETKAQEDLLELQKAVRKFRQERTSKNQYNMFDLVV